MDVGKEGIEAILNSLKGINTEWARNVTTMVSAEAIQEMMKFWARDSEPAGIGYATIIITFQSQPFPTKVDDLCTLMPSAYEQMGVEMVDAECDLKINDLDAARFIIRLRAGALAVKQYQHIYVKNGKIWALTLAVDETKWPEYESTFVTIAESFRVDY